MKEIIIKSRTIGIMSVRVDDEDYQYLTRWRWHISQSKQGFYAMRHETNLDGSQYHVSMHRVIMGVYDPLIEVDHIDHNGMNNQKYNLRNCDGDENRRNRRKGAGASSKYMGVHVRVRKRKVGVYKVWVGMISSRTVSEPRKHFPYTPEGEIAAGKYYDELAKKYYGEFANLNFK